MHLGGTAPAMNGSPEFLALKTTDGVLSLAVPKLLWEKSTCAIFVSVRCGAEVTRFKAISLALHSERTVNKHSFCEVCLKNWVYVYFRFSGIKGV